MYPIDSCLKFSPPNSFMEKIRIAVLASGKGSNFQAIAEEITAGRCNAIIKVLITNNPEAPSIGIAKRNNIPVEILERKNFKTREALDDSITVLLTKYDVQLVVLAGYMLLLKGKKLLNVYKNKIINIHPALLPAFPGVEAQKQAFEYGAKISGVTIHFVDEHLDAGPVIYQEAVDISNCKNAEDAAANILKVEHIVYPKIIDSFSHGHYVLDGRRVRFVEDK